MAKRRKLSAPSEADLERLEKEFRGETQTASPMAPIAQVAAEQAMDAPVITPQDRVETAELAAFKDKEQRGLMLVEIPVSAINPTEIFRDRTVLDKAELDELRLSIAATGLRLPIEVFRKTNAGQGDYQYGLISGYRRLLAVSELKDLTGDDKYSSIKAIVREMDNTQASLAAMVEENEIRANVSQYERGRVAAVAAQSGFYSNIEDAVNQLFPVASKAKRSKVRSFALIFEELGDMLEFPEKITEKQGLRLSSALRSGFEKPIRDALSRALPESPKDEWLVIESALIELEQDQSTSEPSRGGRPKTRMPPTAQRTTSNGFHIAWGQDKQDYLIRINGEQMDREILELLIDNVAHLLDRATS
ncbi:MAG: ParB N-terminal domain-containing protein [Paracoccaceae bacterium]